MMNLDTYCLQIRQIAREAGLFLQAERMKFNPERVEEKSAHNYVSYVDKESEQRLVDRLSRLLPEAGFLAEEGTGASERKPYMWVIDPLDGTTNYIHDMAPYCVSIALQLEGETLIGVVYEVSRGECFHAIKGKKAYLNEKEIRVSAVDTLDKAFVALGFPYNTDEYKATALGLVDKLYGYAGGTRLLGSAAAELCYVACGRFDARVEAWLGPWDVAAGALILQQAGGMITDFAGGDQWQSGQQVLASNGRMHEVIRKMV